MSADPKALSEKKALLRARAAEDRTRVALALHEIRSIVAPMRARTRLPSTQGKMIVRVIGLVASVVGVAKVARLLRFARTTLTAYRVARNWRRTH